MESISKRAQSILDQAALLVVEAEKMAQTKDSILESNLKSNIRDLENLVDDQQSEINALSKLVKELQTTKKSTNEYFIVCATDISSYRHIDWYSEDDNLFIGIYSTLELAKDNIEKHDDNQNDIGGVYYGYYIYKSEVNNLVKRRYIEDDAVLYIESKYTKRWP